MLQSLSKYSEWVLYESTLKHLFTTSKPSKKKGEENGCNGSFRSMRSTQVRVELVLCSFHSSPRMNTRCARAGAVVVQIRTQSWTSIIERRQDKLCLHDTLHHYMFLHKCIVSFVPTSRRSLTESLIHNVVVRAWGFTSKRDEINSE